jgi:ABC-2 type transport system ATP-binding protein
MIRTEDLTKKFEDFTAVEGVNLEVQTGQVLVLLGPNGAGKTTTVRMLSSVLRPTRGHAWVAGFDVVTQAKQVRFAVGMLTEHHGLYKRMNAMDYLAFFGQIYQLERGVYESRIAELLEKFGLAPYRTKRLGEYSKGMRQKLALVRALLHDPPVLIFDEPTSAMDPESARMVRDSIRSLRSEHRTIILCTHNLTEAEELADRIAIMRRAHIVISDTIGNIKARYLGPAEYKIQLSGSVDGRIPEIPPGVQISAQGKDWVKFRINNPAYHNPLLLRSFLDKQLEVISFQELPLSLEQAYLMAIDQDTEEYPDA